MARRLTCRCVAVTRRSSLGGLRQGRSPRQVFDLLTRKGNRGSSSHSEMKLVFHSWHSSGKISSRIHNSYAAARGKPRPAMGWESPLPCPFSIRTRAFDRDFRVSIGHSCARRHIQPCVQERSIKFRKGGIMPNRIHVAFVAGLLATAAFGIAQTTPVIKEVPVRPTSPASGKQMYTTYCAVCHGVDGKGSGPAAAALKEPPTNLAQLARDNGGKFPESHIYTVLQFGMENPAHGSKDMPVWGPALRSLDRGSPAPEMEEHQRLANLTSYLKTLQQ